MARKKKRRRSSGPRGGGDMRLMAAGAAAGWIHGQTGFAAKMEEFVPKIGNDKLTFGAVLWVANRWFLRNAWVGRAAKATLSAGAFEFGSAGFQVSGGGYDPELRGGHHNEVGAIDVDEFIDAGTFEPDEVAEDVGEDIDDDEGEGVAIV